MHQLQIPALLDNPDHYLFGFENGDAIFLRMNRDSYMRSIFFDGRIVTVNDDAVRVPLGALWAAVAQMNAPAPGIGWIFHMAHTGSTLLARALDRPGQALVIREPVTLRALGVEAGATRDGNLDDQRLHIALAMLERRYSDDEAVLVKANVPVNCIIPEVLAYAASAKAVLLHFGLEDYLTAILRGPNHRKWIEHIFAELRLAAHFEMQQSRALHIAEMAAALWLFQIRAYAMALSAYPGVRSLDANILFDEPQYTIMAASEYFGCAIDNDEAYRIVSGELFSTYSKNPAAPFDNSHRKARVAQTRSVLSGDIAIAKRWLERRLIDSPLPARLANPLCGKNSLLL